MMNGSDAGSPASEGNWLTYLVETDARMPMIRPPA